MRTRNKCFRPRTVLRAAGWEDRSAARATGFEPRQVKSARLCACPSRQTTRSGSIPAERRVPSAVSQATTPSRARAGDEAQGRLEGGPGPAYRDGAGEGGQGLGRDGGQGREVVEDVLGPSVAEDHEGRAIAPRGFEFGREALGHVPVGPLVEDIAARSRDDRAGPECPESLGGVDGLRGGGALEEGQPLVPGQFAGQMRTGDLGQGVGRPLLKYRAARSHRGEDFGDAVPQEGRQHEMEVGRGRIAGGGDLPRKIAGARAPEYRRRPL